jgi:hypothetical protein
MAIEHSHCYHQYDDTEYCCLCNSTVNAEDRWKYGVEAEEGERS